MNALASPDADVKSAGHPPRLRPWPLAAVFAALVLSASVAQAAEPPPAAPARQKLKVTADEAKVMLGNNVLIVLKKGEELRRVPADAGWVEVEVEKDGKTVHGWVRTSDVAVSDAESGPNLVKSHTDRARLLQAVFRNPKSWTEHRFTLEDKPTGVRLTDRQIDQLMNVLTAKGNWPAKLNAMARITPLDVRVYCDRNGQVPIKDILATFGQPDEKTPGTICNIASFNPDPVAAAHANNTEGQWYRYGSIRLGVLPDGNILSIQVFGPAYVNEQIKWQAEAGK